MTGFKLYFVVFLSMLVETVVCKPGVLATIAQGIFGENDKDYHKGYQEGFHDKVYAAPPPYYPAPQPYYPGVAPQPYYPLQQPYYPGAAQQPYYPPQQPQYSAPPPQQYQPQPAAGVVPFESEKTNFNQDYYKQG